MDTALAYLIAFWINPLLHGIYVSIFAYWHFQRQESNGRFFTITCWTIFILTNIDAIACLIMLIQGFWQSLPNGGPDTVFGMNMSWSFLLQEYNYLLIIFTCDALMAYRVWRLWQRWKWIALLPLSLLVVETVLRFIGTTYLALGMMDPFEKVIASSLAVNTGVQIVITLLLGYRLLITDDLRSLPPEHRSLRYRIAIAIVESGAIIAICLILDLAFLVNDINAHWLLNLCIPHFYGITTMAIAVRIRIASKQPRTSQHSGQQGRRPQGWPVITVVKSFHNEDGAEIQIDEPTSMNPDDSKGDQNSSLSDVELSSLPSKLDQGSPVGRHVRGAES